MINVLQDMYKLMELQKSIAKPATTIFLVASSAHPMVQLASMHMEIIR